MMTLRRGGGIGDPTPFVARQRISLRRISSVRSASEKSIRDDSAAPKLLGRLFSSSDTVSGIRRYCDMLTVLSNAAYIGVAAASYWLIGGKPRISSIVRSTPAVV